MRDRMFAAYLECALWASVDDDGEPLDSVYVADDIGTDSLEAMRTELADFVGLCEREGVSLDELAPEQVGHDFWLTRNRHGAGFWDRGLGATGDRLTELAHSYGESHLYVSDSNTLEVSS